MWKEVGPSDLFSLKEWKDNSLPLPGTLGAAHCWGCRDLLALLAQALLCSPGSCAGLKPTWVSHDPEAILIFRGASLLPSNISALDFI